MNDSPNGILLIDKPAGMSSFGVVARVRRILSQQVGKKVKVGHAGTLDPFATGLLIILVGTACKEADRFLKLDKSYDATMVLGQTSSTGDPEGELHTVSELVPTKATIEAALSQFRGVIAQTPPIFSAIKINGQRAYALARKGQDVAMPTRQVRIDRLELTTYDYPKVALSCDVVSGTYIRSLVSDIGEQLTTGAYTGQLRRTRIDRYDVQRAITISDDTAAKKLIDNLQPL